MSLENNLFVELDQQESAEVNGGAPLSSSVSLDLGSYIFMIGAGTLFGNPGLTQPEIQFAWEKSLVRPSGTSFAPTSAPASSGPSVPNLGFGLF